MTSQREPISDDELESYLDGALSAERCMEIERRLVSDPVATEAVDMQRRIDESLRRIFAPPAVPTFLEIEANSKPQAVPMREVADSASVASHRPSARYLRRTILLALAASLAWFLVAWQWVKRPHQEPVFVVRALTDIYQETVHAGFQPYYDCNEEERFADAFRRRQKQPLRLAKLAPGQRMLGLSYPGGLSRDTTAMLCHVDDEPVMVFIDRAENDHPITNEPPPPGLHVHRGKLGPLVLYEVSPWDTPRVMDSLQLIH